MENEIIINDKEIKIKNPLKYGKEGDSEIIADYLTPSQQCFLCTDDVIGYKINKDYSEGVKLYGLLKKYKDDFKQATNKDLTMGILKNHFTKHFNAKGAATATYNQLLTLQDENADKGKNCTDVSTEVKLSPSLVKLFDHSKDKYLDDMKLLDLSTRALMAQIDELENIKIDKKSKDPSFNETYIIQQQFTVIQAIYNNVLNKVKTFQKGKLQQAKIEALEHYNLLGVQNYQLSKDTDQVITKDIIESTQKMFAQIVIKIITKLIAKTLEQMNTTPEDRAVFFKTFQNNLKGIDKDILNEFQHYIDETFKDKDENVRE